MDTLWTPWRYTYITKNEPACACIFCEKAAANQDEKNLIIYRGKLNFVVLNLFPYTNGHLMVAPYKHAALLSEAGDDVLTEMMLLARTAEDHLRALYKPEGLNMGLNIGKSAGAGVAGHIHMHVLPRWTGDTSFMSTVAETRVLPETLATTYKRLKAAWENCDTVPAG
jgi:ATP adenylyltransferase